MGSYTQLITVDDCGAMMYHLEDNNVTTTETIKANDLTRSHP